MTLNSYNFNVIYQPGKENYPADSLSRLPLQKTSEQLELPNHAKLLHMRVQNLPMKRSHLERETMNDSILLNVIHCLQTHWLGVILCLSMRNDLSCLLKRSYCYEKGVYVYLSPSNQKNTVRRSTKKTPSQLMFGRHLRSRFALLKPDVMKNIEYEHVQKQHHDFIAAPDQNFIEKEEVWVNNSLSKGSLPGKIVNCTGPLSYLVEIDGILRRKHCDQMRKRKLMININEPPHQDMSD
ncbi:hypothetical protein JTB14_035137 [Gonioctena quinquepunctata]|nr:hypothetical protein JTB14_035137 [Gonioctena quinquepunctata]